MSARLVAVRETGLLDAPADLSLERYVRIASMALGTPVNLVSLVDHNRQFFAAAKGLQSPWAQSRETPLSHSFCQHVVADAKPFIVDDAAQDPRVKGNPAITELSVSAYAGMPITAGSEDVVGSFCAIDSVPRQWDDRELALLSELAGLVSHELDMRRDAQRVQRAEAQIARMDAQLVSGNPDLVSQVDMIAHDLRTPIQTMSILASLLRSHPTMAGSDALLGLLDSFDRNLLQAGKMLDSLSRVNSDSTDTDTFLPIDVNQVVTTVCDDLRPSSEAIAILVQTVDRARVQADDIGMRRCLYNLVSNAIRFASSCIRVSIRTGPVDIWITVEDDGPGLPNGKDWSSVWDPGVTFHGSEGRSNSGLGLAITKQLANRFGGTVSASRSSLGGAQFELHFPACQ